MRLRRGVKKTVRDLAQDSKQGNRIVYQTFHIVHLITLFVLAGLTFQALAAADSSRRKTLLMWSGIASLVTMLAGFGLAGVLKVGFPLWLVVKLVCWLALSAIAGIAFRRPELRGALTGATIGIISLAVLMVSMKPF